MQLSRPLPKHLREIVQIIAGRNAELAHKVPRRTLQVAVIPVLVGGGQIVFGPAEVGVTGDGRRAFEALQSTLGLGLRGRVEVVAAEELVRRDAFLVAEFRAGVFFFVRCRIVSLQREGVRTGERTKIPSAADRLVPVEPKPIFRGAAVVLAPPTCPNPSLPTPMPRRSTSLLLRSFPPVAPNPPALPGLTGVGAAIFDVSAGATALALATLAACSASGS